MSKQVLETLFESRVRVKLLKFLFRNMGGSFNSAEVARHTQEPASAVRRELGKFKEIGLIKLVK
ncbi:MAG: hypothetical protein ABH833_01635 [Parcubacteria group bacterium]